MIAEAVKRESLRLAVWQKAMDQVRGVPVAPSLILSSLILAAIFAPVLAPYDPTLGDLRNRLLPPFWMQGGSLNYPLGTDLMGRDVLSRLIYGARVSLVVGLVGVAVAGALGVALGVVSGYFGKWVDQLVMRITDTWLSFPPLVFAIFLAMIMGPGLQNIIIIVGALFWTRWARIVRGEVLSLKERDFVRLAMVAGASPFKIIIKHIVPNVLNTSVVLATLMMGGVIITEASMSFLGVGVPPPQPAWGLMLSESRATLMTGTWWLSVFPGVALALVVLAANMFGDWLRVILDPQLRQL